MPNLFGVDIAGIIAKNMGNGLLPVVLTKQSTSDRVTGSLSAGPVTTPSNYSCRGFIEDYTDRQLVGTLIQTGDRKITILGGTLVKGIIPATGDGVNIENADYNIIRAKRDPAGATWELQVRG